MRNCGNVPNPILYSRPAALDKADCLSDNRHISNPALNGSPTLLHQFNSRFNGKTVFGSVSPPFFSLFPPLGSGVFDLNDHIRDRIVFNGFSDRVNDIFLDPLANAFERTNETIEQTFDTHFTDFDEYGRRRVNTESFFHTIDKSAYEIANGLSDRLESLYNSVNDGFTNIDQPLPTALNCVPNGFGQTLEPLCDFFDGLRNCFGKKLG